MKPYEVFMHVGLLDSVPRQGAQRRRILNFILSLRQQPNQKGDFTEKDDTLRAREIKIIGDHAVTWWVDSPVRAVMVVDVHPADK